MMFACSLRVCELGGFNAIIKTRDAEFDFFFLSFKFNFTLDTEVDFQKRFCTFNKAIHRKAEAEHLHCVDCLKCTIAAGGIKSVSVC